MRVTRGAKAPPKSRCIGISNRTWDNHHVIFLDYDGVDMGVVTSDIDWLVSNHGASNFLIFRNRDNKGSIHAVCFTKYLYWELVHLLEGTHCDPQFYHMFMHGRYRSNILRLSSKCVNGRAHGPMEFFTIYPRQKVNMHREVSTAHILAYNRAFKIPSLPYKNEDKLRMLEAHCYATGL